jgi:ketol-acid reductoisomerase
MKETTWIPKPVLTASDANLTALQGKTIGVIGFGSQGHAHALNLKENGMNVLVGLLPESKSIPAVYAAGMDVVTPDELTRRADVIMIAVPDMKQAALYRDYIEPNLGSGGKTLLFSHGLAIHYKHIVVPAHTAVIMVAPKGPGHLVRSQFLKTPREGTPALIAVHQDPQGNGREIALSWAHGIGSTNAGVLETTFKEETETDLFGEQAVLCGGLTSLIQAGFDVLVEAGYSPEMAYFEVLHEVKLITDLINQKGIPGMRFSISETAKWGDVSVGPKILGDVKSRMREALADIQNGVFVENWRREYEAGLPNYNRLLKQGEQNLLEKVGTYLRNLMPWIPKVKTGNAQAEAVFKG